MSEKNRNKPVWRVIVENSGRVRVVDSNFNGYQTRHVVAQVCDNGGRRRKNAMLIASAPEMYELLCGLEIYFGIREDYTLNQEKVISSGLLNQIRELTRKARGEE